MTDLALKALPQLPGEILMLIFPFLKDFLVEDALELQFLCKELFRTTQPLLKNKLAEIKNLLQARNFDWKDPLSELQIRKIPFYPSLNVKLIDEIIDTEFRKFVTFKKLTTKQLDRLLGYMAENRYFYRNILEGLNGRHAYVDEIQFRIGNELLGTIIDNYGRCDLFRKFVYFLVTNDSLPRQIRNGYPSVTDYYNEFGPKETFYSEKFQIEHFNELLSHRYFYSDKSLAFRIMHWCTYAFASDLLDIAAFFWIQCVILSQFIKTSGLCVASVTLLLAVISSHYLSPTWTLFKELEAYSHKNWFRKYLSTFFVCYMLLIIFKTPYICASSLVLMYSAKPILGGERGQQLGRDFFNRYKYLHELSELIQSK